MDQGELFEGDRTVSRVRLRVLPWRPRWRGGKDWDDVDPGALLDLLDGDDPVSAVLGGLALLLVLPAVLLLVLGVVVFGVELLALLPLALLLLTGRLCAVRPWVLVVRRTDGTTELVEVRGLRAARRRRREILAG